MQKIILYISIALLTLVNKVCAQEKTFEQQVKEIALTIEMITKEEKNALKIEVEAIDTQELLESDERIEKIANYIIQQHPVKTQNKTFTAMFCVSSVEILIKYYDLFLKLKKEDLCGSASLRDKNIFLFRLDEQKTVHLKT